MENEQISHVTTDGEGPRGWSPILALSIIPVMFGALVVTTWWKQEGPLRKCDAAIMNTLKAPSTYKRISGNGYGATYTVEYDADNSFGVPLRGRGTCTIKPDGSADWFE